MPDLRWALHDFTPENEDELTFQAGDEIEVVEKDDLYGDGWWQGRLKDGPVGLFPVDYTSKHPPTPAEPVPEIRVPAHSTLDSLPEESEHELAQTGDNAVMTATMTDIQHAIDQLAVNRAAGDNNSRRTFSFISRSESERGTEHGQDGEYDSPGGFQGQNRKLLEENASKANSRPQSTSPRRPAPPIPVDMSDESDADDDDEHSRPLPTASASTSVPPTAKASDFPNHSDLNGNHNHIGSDLELLSPVSPTTTEQFNHLFINSPSEGMSPARAASDLDPYGRGTPPMSSTPQRSPALVVQNLPQNKTQEPSQSQAAKHILGLSASLPQTVTPSPPGAFVEEPQLYSDFDPKKDQSHSTGRSPKGSTVSERLARLVSSESTPMSEKVPTIQAPTPKVPSPIPSPALQIPSPQLKSQTPSIHSPANSFFDAVKHPLPTSNPITPLMHAPSPPPTEQYADGYRTLTPAQPTPLSTRFSMPQSAATTASFPLPTVFSSNPMSQTNSQRGSLMPSQITRSVASEWSVEQVADWLRSKKFDDSVVSKFIENDITGDVLLEMDVNMLKELDIPAFGKRMRIANAIGELRRQGSEPSSPNGRNMTDQSYNSNSSMTSASVPNISGLSETFQAGPLSNGNMQQYLHHQQYQQPLPMPIPHNQMGLGMPSAMMYSTSSSPAMGMPAPPGHGRNLSINSSAPSTSMMMDSNGMMDSERGGYAAMGGHYPPQQQSGANGYRRRPSSQDSWNPNPNSAPPQQQMNNVNGSISQSMNGSNATVDRVRSESDPGMLLGATGTGPGSTATSSVNGEREQEGWSKGRASSLRGKPSMSPQEPPGRWTLGQQQNTSGSLRGVPGIAEEKEEVEINKPTPSETSAYEERASMSETDAMAGVKPGLKKRMSTRKAIRPTESSPFTAASDSKSDHSHHSTPVSSIPPSPSVKGSMFGGRKNKDKAAEAEPTNSGTNSARNSKGNADNRMSFFGGTLGRNRKPAPHHSGDFSDTSPTVSSNADKPHRSLSRLYLGGSTRKASSTGRAPAPTFAGAGSTSQQDPKLLMPNSPVDPTASVIRKPRPTSSPPAAPGARGATNSAADSARPRPPAADVELKPGMTALDQIGPADHSGWMRKRGDRYNAWKLRYFALKGPHLYYVKALSETKIKGYINIVGYKVVADENVYPGRYGFRIVHETEKTHYFSSVEQQVVREWMKALMKATIGRDYNRPVVSSCNIPTIPLTVAQAMNPAPRPPSPSARDATQRMMKRENVNQLSSRDALVLMGMAGEPDSTDKARLDTFFKERADANGLGGALPPPRPSREMRKVPSFNSDNENSAADIELITWINQNLPGDTPPATDLSASLSSGLIMYRLAESIKGVPTDVPDSAFPLNGEPEKLEGLFKLFDFLLDNDVKMGSVSINDVRLGHKDKISQLVRSLRSWQERRESLSKNMQKQPMTAGPWIAV
ncbi:polar growth protein [Tulasnella sp. 332]|nr:polar growth protein [Tulasnella sp. 332]